MEDLLWELTIAGEGPSPRPKVYRAPSWSWASVDGQVQIPNTEDKVKPGAYDIAQCTLVQCEVTPAHKESLFTDVTAAFVELETFLHKVTISSGVYSKTESQKLFLDAGEDDSQPGQYVGNLRPDTTDNIDTDQVWIAPILWDRSGYKWVDALVLVAADTENFRRVGLLRSEGDLKWVESGERRAIKLV